jgi:hypothetical protein
MNEEKVSALNPEIAALDDLLSRPRNLIDPEQWREVQQIVARRDAKLAQLKEASHDQRGR